MAYPGYPSGGGGGYPPKAAGSMGPGYPSGPPPPSSASGAYPGYPPDPTQQQSTSWTQPGSSPYPSEGLSFPAPTGGPAPYPTGGPAPYPPGGPSPYPAAGGPAPYPAGGPAQYPAGGPAQYPPGGSPYPSGGPSNYPQSGVGVHTGPSYSSAPPTQQGGMGFGATTPSGHSPAPYPGTSHIPSPYPTASQQRTPRGYQTAPPPVPSASTHQQSTQESHTRKQDAATKGVPFKEPVTEGTVKPSSRFDAENDASILRKAMKGFGTDEKAIISVVAYRSCQQRQEIMIKFKSLYGKDLIKELKSELSGHFEDVVTFLFMKPREFDAYILRKAIQGAGTDESALIEVLCTRSNEEINAIKQQYRSDYSRDVEADVKSDTSGHFRRLLISMLTGARDPNGPVDRAKARRDAQELYQAGEARWGTDESKFNQILAALSIFHLQVIFEEYSKICKYDIEQSIEREMSGDLKEGMLTVVKCVRDKPGYFAERLYKSMKGFGTDDDTLVRVMVSRCEVDMVQIKKKFYTKYYKSLCSFIKGDTSGDYKRILLALAGDD